MDFRSKIKEEINELRNDEKAQTGFTQYYMGILLLSIIVLSVMFPVITEQINAVNASVTSATRTVMGLFLLFLSLGLLIFYMKPLM